GKLASRTLGERNAFDLPGPPQRHRVQKPQRRQHLPVGGRGDAVYLNEMQEETADVGLPQLFRAAPIKRRQSPTIQQVVPPRRWPKPLEDKVLLHPITQLSHGATPAKKKWETKEFTLWGSQRHGTVQGTLPHGAFVQRASSRSSAFFLSEFCGFPQGF